MASAVTRVFKLWQPPLTPNLQSFLSRWKYTSPLDTTTLNLRTTAFFIAAISLAFRAFRNFNQSPLISRISQATYLEIRLQSKGNPVASILVLLASLPLKFSLSLVSAVVGTYFFYEGEIIHAKAALHSWIVSQFKDVVDSKLMDYVAQNPSAVKAVIKSCPENIETTTSKQNSQSLLQAVLGCKQFESFQLIIDYLSSQKKQISKEDFYQILKTEKSDFIIYALSKGVIQVADFNNDEIVTCWRYVKDEETAKALIKHKFDINTINTQGYSPLLYAIADSWQESLAFKPFHLLVKLGAYLENLNTNLTIKIGENDITKSLEEWLKEKPKIWDALLQAHNKGKVEVKNFTSSLFAFLKPTINITSYNVGVAGLDIAARIGIIAWAVLLIIAPIAVTQFKTTFPTTVAVVSASVLLIGTLYYKYAWRIASRELNNIVIAEFKENCFPRSNVMDYICKNPDIIDALIHQKADLNKQDDQGKTLWERLIKTCKVVLLPGAPFLSFTKLADALFTTLSPEKKLECFILALRHEDESYASYILDNNLFGPQDLSDKDQFECWKVCGHKNTIKILSKKGFNINAVDINGYTPLLWAVTKELWHHFLNISRYDYIEALLTIKPNTTIKVNGNGVLDFLTEPEHSKIKELVEKHISGKI